MYFFLYPPIQNEVSVELPDVSHEEIEPALKQFKSRCALGGCGVIHRRITREGLKYTEDQLRAYNCNKEEQCYHGTT